MTKGNYYKRIDKEDDNNLLDKNIQGNKCLNNKILNRMINLKENQSKGYFIFSVS